MLRRYSRNVLGIINSSSAHAAAKREENLERVSSVDLRVLRMRCVGKNYFSKFFLLCAVEKCKSTQKEKLLVIKVGEKNARRGASRG